MHVPLYLFLKYWSTTAVFVPVVENLILFLKIHIFEENIALFGGKIVMTPTFHTKTQILYSQCTCTPAFVGIDHS